MSIESRFFGRREPGDGPADLIGALPDDDSPTLVVLMSQALVAAPAAITSALRAYDVTMADARCELGARPYEEHGRLGLAGWGPHVIQIIVRDGPFPTDEFEACVRPAHWPAETKAPWRAHASHIVIANTGSEESWVEQYVALAAFAGVLHRFGAIAVFNEAGRTAFPAESLAIGVETDERLSGLRAIPLPFLYCGFVKYSLPGETKVWMRTHGCEVLGLPDLAAFTDGDHEGERYLRLLDGVLRYVLRTGNEIGAGHTMDINQTTHLRFRAPTKAEPWLRGGNDVLVTEVDTVRGGR